MTTSATAQAPGGPPARGEAASLRGSPDMRAALPLVRRFARAMTGSLRSGDRRLRQLIETLLADPTATVGDGDARFRSFALFHRVCNGLDRTEPRLETDGEAPLERRLAALAPIERELLLLMYLEDFTMQEAALIVDIAQSEAKSHVLKARFGLRAAARTYRPPAPSRQVLPFPLRRVAAPATPPIAPEADATPLPARAGR